MTEELTTGVPADARRRAYVSGLLCYAVGALAMALAQNVTAIIGPRQTDSPM